MNAKNLLISSLIGAILTAVVSNLPILDALNCLVCLPFWGGPLFAAWYYKRQTGIMTMNQAVSVGTVTGLFAGVFGLFAMVGTFGLANQIKQYLPVGILPADFWVGDTSALFTLTSMVTNIIFGMIGGAVAGSNFNKKIRTY